ncbi:MAG TPA: hypothetical protein VE622_01900 [Nitrososphaeraceae archaeon]|nr:hypothetical protein [Nitrososphaeraceae archaeon]
MTLDVLSLSDYYSTIRQGSTDYQKSLLGTGIEGKNCMVIVLLNQQKPTAIRFYVLFGGVVPIQV